MNGTQTGRLRQALGGLWRRPFLLFIVLFPVVFIALFAQLLWGIHGYLDWGNFAFPLTIGQLAPQFVLWNPYAYGGMINPLPYTNLLNLPVDWLQYEVAYLLGVEVSGKLFVLSASIALALSFYMFAGEITRDPTARVCATAFYAFNPFELMLYSFGDFLLFVYQCALLLSLFLLLRGIRRRPIEWLYVVAGEFVLTLSVPFFQAFYLGVPIFIITAVYFGLIAAPADRRIRGRDLVLFFSSLLLLLPFTAPLLLSFVQSYGTLAPQSAFAPSLAAYTGSSAQPIDLLYLHGYPPNVGWLSADSGLGHLFFPLWVLLWAGTITILLVSYAFTSEKRYLYYPVVALIGALVGSDAASPISSFNIALYQNVPGYQVLAQSYLWDWILFPILYGQGLAELLTTWRKSGPKLLFGPEIRDLASRARRSSDLVSTGSARCGESVSPRRLRLTLPTRGSGKISSSRVALGVLVGLSLISCAVPIVTQGYYGASTNDIHSNSIPMAYSELPPILSSLTGGTYSGVAFLPPDSWAFYNQTLGFTNPLIQFPEYRTAGTPAYRSPNVGSTSYVLWAYQEFYENQTRYFPELMAVAGYTYFVILLGLHAGYWPDFGQFNGVNASRVMEYQYGVKEVYATSSFEIFHSEYGVETAQSVSGFALFLGGYDLLDEAAYAGMNLTSLAIVFPSDLRGANEQFILQNTKVVVSSGVDGVLDFGLCNTSYESILPAQYASTQPSSTTWYSSQALDSLFGELPTYEAGPVYNTPELFATGSAGASLTLRYSGLTPGNYSLYLDVMTSAAIGGTLSLWLNGAPVGTINTTGAIDGMTNSFGWSALTIRVATSSGTVSLDSVSGMNGVSQLVFVPSAATTELYGQFLSELQHTNAPLVSFALPSQLIPPSNTTSSNLQVLPFTSASASGALLHMTRGGPSTSAPVVQVSAPFPNGVLYLQVLDLLGGVFETETHGVVSATGVSSRNGYYSLNDSILWTKTPLSSGDARFMNLTLTYGSVYIGMLVLVSNFNENTSAFGLTGAGASDFTPLYVAPWVENLTVRSSVNSSGVRVAGNFNYTEPNGSFLLELTSRLNPGPSDSIALTFDVSNNSTANIDGYECSGPARNESVVLPGPLYYVSSPSGNLTVTFLTPEFFGLTPPRTYAAHVSFSITIFGFAPAFQANLSSLVFAGRNGGSISLQSDGISIARPSSGLILVRLPFLQGESVDPASQVSIMPSVAGVDSVLSVASPAPARISITYVSSSPFYLSLAIPPLALLVSGLLILAIERRIVWPRRNSR